MTTIYRGSDSEGGRYWTTDADHAANFGAVTEREIDLADFDAADVSDIASCEVLARCADEYRAAHDLDEDDDVGEHAQNIMDAGGYASDDIALWIASRSLRSGVAFTNYEGSGIVVLMKS